MADPSTREATPAFHHVLRRQILRCLEEGDTPRSCGEISEQMGQPAKKVGYHVRVLRDCQAIAQDRETMTREAIARRYRSMVPGNLLIEELLRVTEGEDEEEIPRNRASAA